MNKKEKGDPSFLNSVLSKVDPKKNLLRVETNFSKYEDIRNIFKVKNIFCINSSKGLKAVNSVSSRGVSLIDVLQSKENPILKIYDKIMVSNKVIEFDSLFNIEEINYYKTLPMSKYVSKEGWKKIINANQRDIKKIRKHLIHTMGYKKSIVSQSMDEIRFEIARLNKLKDPKSTLDVVKEIRELLKVA